MGIANVKGAAAQHARGLDLEALAVLLYLSAITFDDPAYGQPARVYFGGHKAIVYALGLADFWDSPTRQKYNATRTIGRIFRRLEDAGAIKLVTASAPGRHSHWLLLIDVPPRGHRDRWDGQAGHYGRN